ncbi:flavin mononucleotide hydrolase 1, chloroplatic isoform X2 [Phoenix dactylifera]|uniref:Flavin mononucleotide hydrolase 1, chloroplatic isoform X2 n=1 Tax=Phoenix dactylifera TaxID=42345 RepID=A0A8B7C4P7_PHODC|nr:flavin mononucleotide hydrolase 1, chloroplatic isoform X2 [Phoenix dactylifera]
MVACLSRSPAVFSTLPRPPASRRRRAMAAKCSTSGLTEQHKLPVLLFDVMDTIVRDPFYHDIPDFFQMSMKELLENKHPTAWAEFEKGLIDENELAKKFFKDGRPFDLEGLKQCMLRGYSYVDGIEELLHSLKRNNYELHAFTNYPIWYKMIEEKLQLSKYLSWTFCSCIIGTKNTPIHQFLLASVTSFECIHRFHSHTQGKGSLPQNFIWKCCIILELSQQAASSLMTGWQMLRQL